MKIVRTIIWVLTLVALAIFSVANWDPTVTVRIWDGIVVDTKIPMIVIVAFLIGFVPTWLLYRGVKWQSQRKIQSLENAVRTAEATPIVPSRPEEPAAPSTVFSENPEARLEDTPTPPKAPEA